MIVHAVSAPCIHKCEVIISAKLLLQRALTWKHYIKEQQTKQSKTLTIQITSQYCELDFICTKRHVCSPRTKCIPIQGDIKSNSPWHTGSQTILMLLIQTPNDLYWQKIVLYRDGKTPATDLFFHLKYWFMCVLVYCPYVRIFNKRSSYGKYS